MLIPASPSRGAARSNLSRTVSQLHVRNLGLCVICALLIENRFGGNRVKRTLVDVMGGNSKRVQVIFTLPPAMGRCGRVGQKNVFRAVVSLQNRDRPAKRCSSFTQGLSP